jgi:hypothetical protein
MQRREIRREGLNHLSPWLARGISIVAAFVSVANFGLNEMSTRAQHREELINEINNFVDQVSRERGELNKQVLQLNKQAKDESLSEEVRATAALQAKVFRGLVDHRDQSLARYRRDLDNLTSPLSWTSSVADLIEERQEVERFHRDVDQGHDVTEDDLMVAIGEIGEESEDPNKADRIMKVLKAVIDRRSKSAHPNSAQP